ncbi:inositol-tetrakisphosphate 1-kinase 3-like isoform X1 [Primulina huaijiensis]|uniref:inositol-tetrakisphosphate 1-kinase 3-like isoform X1 n=1 Tax=Primulina huaijiensis TaxID=1492673 RepID=UPI003CC716B5
MNKACLRLPIVAKPLVAKSHELSLAYDVSSLQKLVPPLVLLEFINHGGVLFKVYVVGEAIKVVRHFSLPDVSKRQLSNNFGVYNFPRVSCPAASADEADLDPSVAGSPPGPLLERLARELRRRLDMGKCPKMSIYLRIFYWTWHEENRELRLAKGVQLPIEPVVTKCYASTERRKSTGRKGH